MSKPNLRFKIKCRFCDKFLSLQNFSNHLQSRNCNLEKQHNIKQEKEDNTYSLGSVYLQEGNQEYLSKLSAEEINIVDRGFRLHINL